MKSSVGSRGGVSLIDSLQRNESVTVSLSDYSAIVLFTTNNSGMSLYIGNSMVIPRDYIVTLAGDSHTIQLSNGGMTIGTLSYITASSVRVISTVSYMQVYGLK